VSARPALEGGADLIQIRAGDLPSRDLAALARAITAAIPGGDRVIVNGRPDLAELVGALGVHLKESGLAVASVRKHFPGLAVGVSRHDRAGLVRAADEGADYAIFGPVFETPGKEARAVGLDRFRAAVDGLSLPVVAVGGITAENAAGVLAAGAAGVAAIRPFQDAAVAAFRAADFRRALDRAGGNPV
jgi:thiamine-phosphate pyrophosphorylase